MNKEICCEVQINILLDELQEIGINKFGLIDMIKGKSKNQTIDYLKTIKGEMI